jgi:hypothetical protein
MMILPFYRYFKNPGISSIFTCVMLQIPLTFGNWIYPLDIILMLAGMNDFVGRPHASGPR